jgi:magnesium-transporting ATPase (P-type)
MTDKVNQKQTPSRLQRNLAIIAIVCCAIALASLIIAFIISGDKTYLFKSGMPLILTAIAVQRMRANKKNTN